VLLVDNRGHGASEGDPNAFGWDDETDVNAALDYLTTRADVDADRIGGLGLSVGGETLLETAAHTDRLRAVVSEGAGGRTFKEDLAMPGAAKWVGLRIS
jgi:dienelactone hydrolase